MSMSDWEIRKLDEQYGRIADARAERDFVTRTIAQVDAALREQEREQLQAEEHYNKWLDELVEQDDRYYSQHCPVHGVELVEGFCQVCVKEENVSDY